MTQYVRTDVLYVGGKPCTFKWAVKHIGGKMMRVWVEAYRDNGLDEVHALSSRHRDIQAERAGSSIADHLWELHRELFNELAVHAEMGV